MTIGDPGRRQPKRSPTYTCFVREIYLDHASTTPPHPAALAAMSRAASEIWGDPSRLYRAARVARIALDEARAAVAAAVGGRPEEIVFTSGGTESCNLAIAAGARAAAAARKPRRILVSAVEHTAVLEAADALDGFEVVRVGVDSSGRLDLDAWRDECARGAGLVSIQSANQEVGTIQPVAEAAAAARQAGAIVHSDACMAVGRIPVDAKSLGVDLLSASGHKTYGPRGVGVLWARTGVRVRPVMVGDDRERRRRAGIENLPAIAGLAAALQARAAEIPGEMPRLHDLAGRLRRELPTLIDDVQIHGDPDRCLPGLVAFSILYLEGEALLLMLDGKGLAVHSGSSCVSSAQEPSHVLAAMGALTHGSVRVSLGRSSTEEDVDMFLKELPPIVASLRRIAEAGSA